jgi:hypothetical protein
VATKEGIKAVNVEKNLKKQRHLSGNYGIMFLMD